MELQQRITKYLTEKFHATKVNEFRELGKGVYGTAFLIDFDTPQGKRRVVLKKMNLGGFGHDYFSDIAGNYILENSCYGNLPQHIKSFDVIGVTPQGALQPCGDSREFYILMEEARGREYNKDLNEVMRNGATDRDRTRARKLAEYLVRIHAVKKDAPPLYIRRARELVCHGEYIMGVLDGYPTQGLNESFISRKEFTDIARNCVDWWMKLKEYTHRLSQVHGDYHPFNVMFQDDDSFIVLDRSRGEWGEPADDVTAMLINYLFWSLIKYGDLRGEFRELFDIFLNTYLEGTGDKELLDVVQPFFAFRAIVVANPVFYPDEWFEKNNYPRKGSEIRRKLFNFTRNVLKAKRFDPKKVNSYLRDKA